MAQKRIPMLVGDYVEDYEAMVPFQALRMVGHEVHAVCPGRKEREFVRTAFMTLKAIKRTARNAVTTSS